jgi:hypothetical protein
MARSETKPSSTYYWCDRCRRSFGHDELGEAGRCPVCRGPLREMGKFQAILRGLMSNELAASDLMTRHRQLVRLIWTRNGMGERYYRALAPDMPYNRFEARVTELLCRGAAEGWVRFVLPSAPSADESAYRVEFESDERFVAELEALVAAAAPPAPAES